MMRRSLLYISLLMLIITTVYAEELDPEKQVSGFIYSPDGARIAGVQVIILESGQKVRSGSKGEFRFDRILRENITLKISSQLYMDEEFEFDLTKGCRDLNLKFSRQREYSETIVITGTMDKRLLEDVLCGQR